MNISDKLTVIFKKSDFSVSIEDYISSTPYIIRSPDLKSPDIYLKALSDLKNLKNMILETKTEFADKEGEIKRLEDEINSQNSKIIRDYEYFSDFPEDMELNTKELIKNIPDENDIKNFEKKIGEMREQEKNLKKWAKYYKIIISILLVITIWIFIAFGTMNDIFKDYSLLLSIASLVSTFLIIIFLNQHRDKVDRYREIQDNVDDQAKQFDNTLLDKIKNEGKLNEILHLTEVDSASAFFDKLASYEKLKKQVEELQLKLNKIKNINSGMDELSEQVLSKFKEIISSIGLKIRDDVSAIDYIDKFNNEMKSYSKLIFQDQDVEYINVSEKTLEIKSSDRLSIGCSIFHAKAVSTNEQKIPVLFENAFSEYNTSRFTDIFDFVFELTHAGNYKFILTTNSVEQFKLVSDILSNRKDLKLKIEDNEDLKLLSVI